ncbi:Pyoverdine sidechain peptide synthetase I, epsilon-Lys module [Pseudomonas savastanoi pv. glycinea]|nr:Pyoverdine sidechain peptide synthetase I, epsilon-Lys module [Pseudomonas savastanoi pv. glycinea]
MVLLWKRTGRRSHGLRPEAQADLCLTLKSRSTPQQTFLNISPPIRSC